MSDTQTRGKLTPRIKAKSKELMGYEIDVTELRLMPYVQFTMGNTQRMDASKITSKERQILQKWQGMGYIESPMSGMEITKEFWDIISEIIYLGYVDLD